MTEHIVTQVAALDAVMAYYAGGFQADVRRCEYWIDPGKREVVFRLTVADGDPQPPAGAPAAVMNTPAPGEQNHG